MTQPSGWYDDPNDASQLRYWDGVVWTSHVAPRKSPTVDQSGIGAAAGPRQHRAVRQSGPAGGSTAGQGQHGQQPPVAPPWQGVQLGRPQPTTPDGVLLSGWWRRVAARIVDGVICAVLTAVVTFPALGRAAGIMSDFFRASIDRPQTGGTPPPAPRRAGFGPAAGQPGEHRHLHRSTRSCFSPGAAPRRAAASWGSACGCGSAPGRRRCRRWCGGRSSRRPAASSGSCRCVGFLGSLFTILDSLWPLWDERRQALHDKAGATNVVLRPAAARVAR